MTPLEILEAHTVKRPWSEASLMRCRCGEVVTAETEAQLYALHRAHVAEALDEAMREREGVAWVTGYEAGSMHAVLIRSHIDGLTERDPKRPINPYRKATTNGR